MPKFKMGVELRPYDVNFTARLGGDAGATPLAKADNGKFVKFAAGSRFDMCAVGDKIEAVVEVAADLPGTYDGYVLGSLKSYKGCRVEATADGLEATAGTGTIAVGDYVVCGTVVAKGTALSVPAKVCKATNQPGTAVVSVVGAADTAAAIKTKVDEALVKVADAQKNVVFAWRVIEILSGTGVPGDKLLIERV